MKKLLLIIMLTDTVRANIDTTVLQTRHYRTVKYCGLNYSVIDSVNRRGRLLYKCISPISGRWTYILKSSVK